MDSGNESGKHTQPDVHHAEGNGGDDFEFHPNVNDRGQGSEVSNSTTHGGELSTKAKNTRSGSSSRSSSVSSSEDLFHVDTNKLNPNGSISFSLKPNADSQSGDVRSPGTASSQVPSLSPTQTPPVQLMDRSEGYDPNRIPSNVFESNSSTTPMDWSVASNDSLFSLNVGSVSFSREQFLREFGKSGDFEKTFRETGRHEELSNKSTDFIMFSPPTPVQSPVPHQMPSLEIDRNSGGEIGRTSITAGIIEKPTIAKIKNIEEKQNKVDEKIQALPLNSPRFSAHSDGNSSSHSFAFPILTDTTKSSGLKADHAGKQHKQKSKPQQQQPQQSPQHHIQQQPESPAPKARPKFLAYKCLPCFSFCRRCRCCRCSC